jgi:Protein of unknown function (DUF1566)/Regulator of chromosome condensation (RCC1) repeat
MQIVGSLLFMILSLALVRCSKIDFVDHSSIVGDTMQRPSQRLNPLGYKPMEVSIGNEHACARTVDGITCWGYNQFDQTSAPNLNHPIQMTAGDNHTCVLTEEGVKCWGRNLYGETIVPILNHPIAVSAKGAHSCALTEDGVTCWGDNKFKQNSVPILNNPIEVSTGINHTCALTDDSVKCWGDNQFGQTTIPFLNHPVHISAGGFHTCAITDNEVKCWGSNENGQTNVPALNHPIQISAGGSHTCALTDDGVRCWGQNINDQTSVPYLKNPSHVFAGPNISCATTDDGLRCWGMGNVSRIPISGNSWTDVSTDDNQKLIRCGHSGPNCSFKDNLSHLEWTKNFKVARKWSEAADFCKDLNFNNHGDWRLPTASEILEGAIHGANDIAEPAFGGGFQLYNFFWSSSTDTKSKSSAHAVMLGSGAESIHSQESNQWVICVRGLLVAANKLTVVRTKLLL